MRPRLAGLVVAGTTVFSLTVAVPAPAASKPPVTATTTNDTLKAPMVGVVDRQRQPTLEYQNIVSGWIVKVNWADLQPTPDTLNTSAIDAAVSAAVQQEQRTRKPVGLKLRVYAGTSAPQWAKELGGAPVAVYDAADAAEGTIGRFWKAEFGNAYTQLQQRLALRYDTVPQIRDIVVSRCSTFYAEPMLRQISDGRTVASLLAAGYSIEADQICHREALAAHQVWAKTRTSMAFNPYQAIYADGSSKNVVEPAIALMDECRTKLGRRCVLGNNSIRDVDQGRLYEPLYEAIRIRGGDRYFQTATLERLTSLSATISWAIDQGAECVELPAGYATAMSKDQLRVLDSQLEANA